MVERDSGPRSRHQYPLQYRALRVLRRLGSIGLGETRLVDLLSAIILGRLNALSGSSREPLWSPHEEKCC